MRALSLSRLTVCALLVGVVQRASAAPEPQPPPGSGVVSLRLQSQLQALQAKGGNFLPNTASMVRVEVVANHDPAGAIRRLGGTVTADVAGAVVTARVPANHVRLLASQSGVEGVFAPGRMRAESDESVADIRANQVWTVRDAHNLPIQGDHVLVGIVDSSGVDYHSADFKQPDGTTRILSIWDQTVSGNPPAGFHFGYECNTASIQSGSCPERDNVDGHGTHVLGIAAGNGLSGSPAVDVGVAPHADMLVVKSDLTDDNVIAGWKYLVNVAHRLHEPIVIVNSFGSQDGPHDGSEPQSLAINHLAGPGVLFVKSAGNAGHEGAHAAGRLSTKAPSTLTFAPTGYSDGFDMDIFYNARDAASVELRNVKTGERFGPIKQGGKVFRVHSRDGDTRVTIVSGAYSSRYREVYVLLESASHRGMHGQWRLVLHGSTVRDSGVYNAWMLGEDDAEFQHSVEADTLTVPGDARSVITVGDYATSTNWRDVHNQLHQVCDNYVCVGGTLSVGQIAASSSQGPTRDGRHKPDISAPGTMITSTLTHDIPACSNGSYENCIDPAQISPDGEHLTYSGTSMAAPHVAGTLALLLQVDPQLDPAAATTLLADSARHDAFTGSAHWTPTFGAGKVDALGAIQQLMHNPAAQ